MPSEAQQSSPEQVPPDRYVQTTLRRLEIVFREQSLLALADWEQSGLTLVDYPDVHATLFAAIASLQRPSWGHWNGLLTALRKARAKVVDAKIAERTQRLGAAAHLNRLLDWIETPLVPDVVSQLKPFRELAHGGQGGRMNAGQVIALAITLRNRIAHDAPDDPVWWQTAAAALRPLVEFIRRTQKQFVSRPVEWPSPWFVARGKDCLAFNGLEKAKTPLYVGHQGVAVAVPEAAQSVLASFRRLLGQEQIQDDAFRKLLSRLAPEELKGVLLGDFLVGPPVAAGGFATVHVGRQLSTGRKVAIKILNDVSDEQRWRFQQEAAYLAQFDHPHIVRVFGYGEDTWLRPKLDLLDGAEWFNSWARSSPVKSYIAMEWLEGPTLDQVYLDSVTATVRSADDLRRMATWFLQAAEALAIVHEQRLIHRDLKPSNLMVTADGRLKLMDFGIARTLSEARTLKTARGDVLGTPAYMAPEQLRAEAADAAVGPAIDLYALCATFYELFTGARLFNHDTTDAATVVMRKLQGERPEPARQRRTDLPWEIETIIAGGLQSEATDRYPSAAALAEDLRRFLADQPIRYRKPNLRRRSVLFYRRNRALVRLAAVFVALGVFGLGGSWLAVSRERGLTEEANELATEKGRLAKEKEKEAERHNLLKRREIYISNMKTAWNAWLRNAIREMPVELDKYDPGRAPDDAKLRGFEWYFLKMLLTHGRHTLDFDGLVHTARFNPNGGRIAAVGTSHNQHCVKIWTLPAGQLERTLQLGTATNLMANDFTDRGSPLGGTQAVAFNADGSRIAAACLIIRQDRRDGIVKVWEADTGREVFSAVDAGLCGYSVAFSPDGKYLLAGGYDKSVFVWSLDDGKLTWTLPSFERGSLNRSKQIPEGIRPGPHAGIHQVVTSLLFIDGGTTLSRDGPERVDAVHKRREGDRLATAWPPGGAGKPKRMPLSNWTESAVAYSPDGNWAVAPDDQFLSVRLIDMRYKGAGTKRTAGRVARADYTAASISIENGEIRCVALSNNYLALVGSNGLVDLGHLDRNGHALAARKSLRGHGDGVKTLAFSTDSKQLAAAGASTVTVWETRDVPERILLEDRADRRGLTADALRRLGRRYGEVFFALGSRVGDPSRITVIDASTSEVVARFETALRKAGALVASPDHRYCAISEETQKTMAPSDIQLFDSRAGSQPRVLNGHTGKVTSLTFDSTGKQLLSASYDGTVRIWDVAAAREIRVLRMHDRPVTRALFTGDGQWIVARDPKTIVVWPTDSDEAHFSIEHTRGGDWTCSGNGMLLAACAADSGEGGIDLWDIKSKQRVRTLSGTRQWTSAMAFTSDAKRLLTCTNDGVAIWSVDSSEDIFTLPVHVNSADINEFAPRIERLERDWRAMLDGL